MKAKLLTLIRIYSVGDFNNQLTQTLIFIKIIQLRKRQLKGSYNKRKPYLSALSRKCSW